MSKAKEIIISDDAKAMDMILAEQEKKQLTMREADNLYGEGKEYDRIQIMEKAKSYISLAQNSIIESGRCFILLKAHEEHGAFLETLSQIGVDARMAQSAMRICRIFGKYENFSHLSASKLNVLGLLTSGELSQLDDGDEISGITLDDIDRMTAKELRATLRKERTDRSKERDALEDVVRKKEAKISDLEMENAGRQPPTKEQTVQVQLDAMLPDLFRSFSDIQAAVQSARDIIAKAQKIPDITVTQLDEWVHKADGGMASLDEMKKACDAEYETMLDNTEDIRPDKGEA